MDKNVIYALGFRKGYKMPFAEEYILSASDMTHLEPISREKCANWIRWHDVNFQLVDFCAIIRKFGSFWELSDSAEMYNKIIGEYDDDS